MGFIQMVDVVILSSANNEEVRKKHASDWTEEDGISTYKGEKPCGARFYLPRTNSESNDCAEILSSSDVHVSGEKCRHVVCERHGVPGQVVADGCECEEKASEKFRCSIIPYLDQLQGVPIDSAVDHL